MFNIFWNLLLLKIVLKLAPCIILILFVVILYIIGVAIEFYNKIKNKDKDK